MIQESTMKAFILILLLSPNIVWANCSDNAQIREVKGEKIRAEALYDLIKEKETSWRDNFHDEEFHYIGRLENGLEIAQLTTVWGQACRATNRLLIFHKNQFIGNYGGIPDTPKISVNKLIYDYAKKLGSEIDFQKGIPKEVYLDGEFFTFATAKL